MSCCRCGEWTTETRWNNNRRCRLDPSASTLQSRHFGLNTAALVSQPRAPSGLPSAELPPSRLSRRSIRDRNDDPVSKTGHHAQHAREQNKHLKLFGK